MIRIRTEISADAKHFECILSSVSNLDPDSNVLEDPDPGRPTLSLLGWRFLLEPEYSLEEFKKTYGVLDQIHPDSATA
jgi:hypothetical protein